MERLTPRVLVVDDDDAVRRFAERGMREGGYEVTAAPNGPDALQLVADGPRFDLFVVDVVMPQMSGNELARRLRYADPDVKVLYFTGYSDSLFRERSLLWANEAFLEKPVTVRGLLEAASLLLFGHIQGPGTRAT